MIEGGEIKNHKIEESKERILAPREYDKFTFTFITESTIKRSTALRCPETLITNDFNHS